MILGVAVSETTETLDLGVLGVQVVLHPPGTSRDDDVLSFDVLGRPRGFLVQPHVHDTQEERLEVISGQMEVMIGRRRHVVRCGDEFTVPAGRVHRQRPAGPAEGHVRVSVRPAGRTEEFLRCLASLTSQGGFTSGGFPRPAAAAMLIRDFADTGHAPIPLRLQLLLARAAMATARLWREYAFRDEWEVRAPAQAVYAALADARTYPNWWRPVYIGVVADGPAELGSISTQHFRGRLPYHLRTQSTITSLEPGRLLEADVRGDLRGHGVWRLTPTPSGTHVRFEWTVFAERPLLRIMTPVLRPLLRANHNWAISRAQELDYVLRMEGGRR